MLPWLVVRHRPPISPRASLHEAQNLRSSCGGLEGTWMDSRPHIRFTSHVSQTGRGYDCDGAVSWQEYTAEDRDAEEYRASGRHPGNRVLTWLSRVRRSGGCRTIQGQTFLCRRVDMIIQGQTSACVCGQASEIAYWFILAEKS